VGANGSRRGERRQAEVRPRDLRRRFFGRLRERVAAAGERGIYVAVMLFEGWGIHLSTTPLHIEGHPFHRSNNVNGVAIESIHDYQVLPLDPRMQELQERYVGKVIDTVQDLPKVLWEVANESSFVIVRATAACDNLRSLVDEDLGRQAVTSCPR
jgi:hypothetical protein